LFRIQFLQAGFHGVDAINLLRAGVPPERPWISTFHSMCARFCGVRRCMRLAKDFAIYDDDDQLAAVKLAMPSCR